MSRRYEDYLKSRDLCIWPDCDCEIRCNHIACVPPCQIDCGMPCEKVVTSIVTVEKPRYRIYYPGTSGIRRWCSHYVLPLNLDGTINWLNEAAHWYWDFEENRWQQFGGSLTYVRAVVRKRARMLAAVRGF